MRAYLHLPHGILCFGTSSILSLALNSCIILNLCIIRCSECCVLWLHVLNFEGMLYSCAICILEYWTYGIKICEKSVYMQEVFQTNTGIHTHTHTCVYSNDKAVKTSHAAIPWMTSGSSWCTILHSSVKNEISRGLIAEILTIQQMSSFFSWLSVLNKTRRWSEHLISHS